MSTEAPLEDSLTTRISSALEHHPHLKHRKLRIEASEGRVVLRGTVKTYYHKQMAQEALRRMEGVERIENEVEVCWS